MSFEIRPSYTSHTLKSKYNSKVSVDFSIQCRA